MCTTPPRECGHARFLTALVLFFLLPLATVCAAGSDQEALPADVQRTVYEAGQAMNAKKYSQAENILQRHRSAHADAPHYLVEFTLGNALAMQEKTAAALKHYTISAQLRPDFAPAWQNIGKSAHDLGDYSRCATALAKTYELTGKKEHGLLFNAAASHIMAGENKKALPLLERLGSGAAGTPRQEWMEALVKVCLDLGLEKKAAKAVQGMVERHENDPRWWKLLAQLHTRQNEYKKGLAAWEIYATLASPSTEEVVLMGDLYSAVGVPSKAAHQYERALPHKSCPVLREKLAEAHLAAHDPAKAVAAAKAALGKKETARLWQIMGRAYFELGQFKNAYDAFTHSARLDPEDGRPHIMRGYCALRLHNKGMAQTALEKARQFKSSRAQAEQLLKATAAL